jgi:hypothetical protein
MRDKHVGKLKNLSYAQTVEAAEVEEHSPSLIMKTDKENGVLKSTVEESGGESVRHNLRNTTHASLPQVPFKGASGRRKTQSLFFRMVACLKIIVAH